MKDNRFTFTIIGGALVGVLVGLLYLNYVGYWDTWGDKKDEIRLIIKDDIKAAGEKEEIAEFMANCMSDVMVTGLSETTCKVPLRGESLIEAIEACFNLNQTAAFTLFQETLKCMQSAEPVYEGLQQGENTPENIGI